MSKRKGMSDLVSAKAPSARQLSAKAEGLSDVAGVATMHAMTSRTVADHTVAADRNRDAAKAHQDAARSGGRGAASHTATAEMHEAVAKDHESKADDIKRDEKGRFAK